MCQGIAYGHWLHNLQLLKFMDYDAPFPSSLYPISGSFIIRDKVEVEKDTS